MIIDFSGVEKKFSYPDAFTKFLSLEDNSLLEEIRNEAKIKQEEKENEAKLLKEQKESQREQLAESVKKHLKTALTLNRLYSKVIIRNGSKSTTNHHFPCMYWRRHFMDAARSNI